MGLAEAHTYVQTTSYGGKHVMFVRGSGLGGTGFGIYDLQLRTPTGARDYMTYCSNEWVSDYSWEQTLEVIETLTSWDYGDAPPDLSRPLLAGANVRAPTSSGNLASCPSAQEPLGEPSNKLMSAVSYTHLTLPTICSV